MAQQPPPHILAAMQGLQGAQAGVQAGLLGMNAQSGQFMAPPQQGPLAQPAPSQMEQALAQARQQPSQAQQAPQMAPPPAPSPSPQGAGGAFVDNATNAGLFAGGTAAAAVGFGRGHQQGSLGQSLAAGLAAGTQAFTAAKQAERDLADQRKLQEDYAKRISALDLPEDAKAGLIGMGPEAGSKMLADAGLDVWKEDRKPQVVSKDSRLVKGDGTVILDALKEEKPMFDRLPSSVQQAWAAVLDRPITDNSPFTPEERLAMNRWMLQNSKNLGGSISVGGPGGQADQTNMVMFDEMYRDGLTVAKGAYDSMAGYTKTARILDRVLASGDSGEQWWGGAANIADIKRGAYTWAKALGLPISAADIDALENTEMVTARINALLVSEIKSNFGGQISDQEIRTNLEKLGSTNLSPAASMQIWRELREDLQHSADYAKRQMDQFHEDLDYLNRTSGRKDPYQPPARFRDFPSLAPYQPPQKQPVDSRGRPLSPSQDNLPPALRSVEDLNNLPGFQPRGGR